MFGFMHIEEKNIAYDLGYYIDVYEILMFMAAFICSMPVFKNILQSKSVIKSICVNIWLLILFLLSASAMAATTYNPFIYFRF